MNQLDALVTILEATIELDNQPSVRRARKVLTKMADKRREARERRLPNKKPLTSYVWPEVIPAWAPDPAIIVTQFPR